MHHPDEPRDASYDRAKALIQLAEACGFTTTLIAQDLINPRNAELDQFETWTTAAALAEATHQIEIIAAIKPLLVHPAWYLMSVPRSSFLSVVNRRSFLGLAAA